ncbi:1,4-alpha-glucan branching protein GlgB [Kitasatospora sp. NPDC088391]|uniref:1,4-alpha-glucan branching protein GlgB n=1 Tax=Kitasatospora sp. NPDC088391 TaxID=3364074 RepID=UPI0037FE152D
MTVVVGQGETGEPEGAGAGAEPGALGALDLHLIGEGRHEELWRVLGAHERRTVRDGRPVRGVSFAVWAPRCREVRVVGDFNGWDGSDPRWAMRPTASGGLWELFVPGARHGDRYKFRLRTADGRWLDKADPLARAAEAAPGTASVVHSSSYAWGDDAWLAGRAAADGSGPMRVYEVHLPSWRPGLGYRELAGELPAYARSLGFTHVEFLPVAQHPFGGSWGYQATSYYAPMAAPGSPDDFRFLVDRLHRAGVGVLLDWVPAHFPRDDWALARFDGEPLYEYADPRRGEHPDWGTLVFDHGRPEVRNFLVANALYWCEEFHVDGLRVDAVASMLYRDYSRGPGGWTPNRYGGREDLEAIAFLQELNATVRRRCPGVVTIAEESTAWEGVTREPERGGLGFGLKWNMGWMHDSLGYIGTDPVHRRHHHRALTFPMLYAYAERFLLPVSHDEVVHGKGSLLGRMPGDRWQRFANLRAYLALMWAWPGRQLLFMGQEFGQESEWSHDLGPDWRALGDPSHRGVLDLVRDLNLAASDLPALWRLDHHPDGFRWIEADRADENRYSFVRLDGDGTPVVCVFNFRPAPARVRLGLPRAGGWAEVLNTDAAAYGGSGVGNAGRVVAEPLPGHGFPASAELTVPPLAALWLRPEQPGIHDLTKQAP